MKSDTAELSRPLAITTGILQFGYKQLMACLFGVSLLIGVILTSNHPTVFGMARFDFLFLYAIGFQILLIVLRLEHWREVLVIVTFHFLAMCMELFKTSPEIGSWRYPAEGAFFRLYQVPLFAGFLYSAVGSYIARTWRLFDFHFENYPSVKFTLAVAVIAYFNFYTHHYIPDLRWPLIIASLVGFRKCQVHFFIGETRRKGPLLVGLLILSFLIWIAENIGTYARGWAYPNQEHGWELVHIGKISSWYLLMLLSFVLVSLIQLKSLRAGAVT